MSSTNYKLLHTRDERLTNQPVHFAVKTGGSSISNVEYNAQSKSTTSHSWQINPPAGVFIDRRVMEIEIPYQVVRYRKKRCKVS